LFNSLELSDSGRGLSRITDLLVGRSPAELQLVERVLTSLLGGLDKYRG
jgi:hypothetical protein